MKGGGVTLRVKYHSEIAKSAQMREREREREKEKEKEKEREGRKRF